MIANIICLHVLLGWIAVYLHDYMMAYFCVLVAVVHALLEIGKQIKESEK